MSYDNPGRIRGFLQRPWEVVRTNIGRPPHLWTLQRTPQPTGFLKRKASMFSPRAWIGKKTPKYFAQSFRDFDAAISGFSVSGPQRRAAARTGMAPEATALVGSARSQRAWRGARNLGRGMRALPARTKVALPILGAVTFAWGRSKRRKRYYTQYFE